MNDNIHKHALEICRQKGVNLGDVKDAKWLTEIAFKNTLIWSLYARVGRNRLHNIAHVTGVPLPYVKKVVNYMEKECSN